MRLTGQHVKRHPDRSRLSGRMPGTRSLASVASLALIVAACATGERQNDGRLAVAATIGMIADIVERVGGDRVRVKGLMGPGVDPHLYKARAGDVRTLSEADVIFYNGLHLEAAMAELLEEMGDRKRTKAVTDGIDRGLLLAPPEFAGAYDPHVWFDVTLWMRAVEAVADELAGLDPAGVDGYTSRRDTYLEELVDLDAWVRSRTQEVPEAQRVLITAHDAFNYFGRAYGFEVKGLQGISTASEAGTADVQRLVAFILERGVPALFVETSVPRRTVEAVQAAVRSRGAAVEIGGALFSDAMGDAGTREGSYVGMVRYNVNMIVDALLGRGGE